MLDVSRTVVFGGMAGIKQGFLRVVDWWVFEVVVEGAAGDVVGEG